MNELERRLHEAMTPEVETLRSLIVRPAWMRDALCREYPNVEFFLERGEDSGPAKAVCSRCSVRDECIAFAAESGEAHGVWGGLSARQRTLLRRDAA